MTLLRALILTASLFVAAREKDPLAPYVFVAGVEGTGHHWFTSFFGKCKKAGECESSEVGVFEWQWVLAQIKKKPDAAQFAVRAAAAAAAREGRQPASAPRGRAKAANPRALRVLNTMGAGKSKKLAKQYRRSNVTVICSADFQGKGGRPNCQSLADGEQSYPNYGGPRKPEQMPEMGFLATALGAHGQLRVVVLTRDAAAIAASVCDHRHFGGPLLRFSGEATGDKAADAKLQCAKELELLATAARLIAAQVAALPATVVCDHYDQKDLTDATRGGLARLGAYLGIDATRYAVATNAGHAPSKPEPPHPGRDALIAALDEAQDAAAAACLARRPA